MTAQPQTPCSEVMAAQWGTMSGYSTKDVSDLLKIPPSRVRSFVREGFVEPRAGRGGAYQFSFQDVVLMRAARDLVANRVPARRVWQALRALREEMPNGAPLSSVRLTAVGDKVVITRGDTSYHPESGQVTLDFDVAEVAGQVAPLARRLVAEASEDVEFSSDDWFDLGIDLEAVNESGEAHKAYEKALALDENHAAAHINLGRLLHQLGDPTGAERHFRQAFLINPDDPTACYNLGVALDELQRGDEALVAYRRTLKLDPAFADAHYNLALIYERHGNQVAAVRHFSRYRSLTGQSRS